MFHLILGRNGSGKTEYIRELFANKLLSGEKGYVIIVPEQFSFETERDMLKRIGADKMLNLEVLSFSRLAETILEKHKKNKNPRIDNGMRAVLMNMALEGLTDNLEIYKKYIGRPNLIETLLTFSSEIKQCNISPLDLTEVSNNMEDCHLKRKLYELSTIMSMYDAMVQQSYFDDLDAMTELSTVLDELDYFNKKTVAIDAFSGFTKQEKDIISKIFKGADETYITFCTDKANKDKNEFSIFQNIGEEIAELKNIANENNIKIEKPLILENKKDDKPAELIFLEKNIFRTKKEEFKDDANAITICAASNNAEECDFVARTIKKLLREEHLRCRDIAVIERQKDTYDRELTASFKKFDIPFFEDNRQPIDTQPLMIYVRTLLLMAGDSTISTEELMRHLKSGLSQCTVFEIGMLQNYVVLWNINGAAWKKDFTGNPKGYGYEMDEKCEQELKNLNELRKRIIAPILAFKRDFKDLDGEGKSKQIYDYLISSKADKALKEFAIDLGKNGNEHLKIEQNRIWEMLMDILGKLAGAIGERVITSAKYKELFETILWAEDMGEIPSSLDEVSIGSADRMRMGNRKVVFVIGANEGVFPLSPSTEGLLNDKDRKKLDLLGIKLTGTAEYKTVEEHFLAYHTLSSATHKLYVSYSLSDYSGASMFPSEIVNQLERCFKKAKKIDTANIPCLDKIEGAAASFEVMAELFFDNTEFSESLKAYFLELPDFKDRAEAVTKAAVKAPILIDDKNISQELFGKNMFVSASRVEVYHKCPFEYFCKHGINARPLKAAELDMGQSGTVIHYVLESIFRKFNKDALLAMSTKALKSEVDFTLKTYLDNQMGSESDKTERFMYLYNRLAILIIDVLTRIIDELKTSDFIPTDFELKIDTDGEISPYEVKLENGGSIKVRGSVDRVDVMKKDEKAYTRVIDYKSGKKSFVLSDTFYGLNLQMMIYLFAIASNGNERYGEVVPSGVLYVPARQCVKALERDATDDKIKLERIRNGKMNGIVLNNSDVIVGMEKEVEGSFIPVTYDKASGKFQGDLINASDLSEVKTHLDKTLEKMAISLQEGEISAIPVCGKNYENVCTYCDYKTVCGFESGDETREIPTLPLDEAIKELKKEETNNG
ncbi:MAG: PD-(D/E)XK nuclease family protein [Oscillospiraceae bacterium]